MKGDSLFKRFREAYEYQVEPCDIANIQLFLTGENGNVIWFKLRANEFSCA